MEKESAVVPASSGERRRRSRAAVVVMLLLGGWVGFMIMFQQAPIMVLPGGTKISFVDVTEGKPSRGPSSSFQNGFIHYRENKKTWMDTLRAQLPVGIEHWLPGRKHSGGRSSGFESPVSKALWFSLAGSFNTNDWRFFWVDDQGYETEALHWLIETDRKWLGFDGNVPRSQERLHLKVRTRTGERDGHGGTLGSLGKLGDVVAEMKFRNPLRSNATLPTLTAQPYPAKVSIGGDEITLTRAVRARVVGGPTPGMHFELFLGDRKSVTERYDLYDWTLEDGTGNIMVPGSGSLSHQGQFWDRALWSDVPVWKVSFVAVRSREKDFTDAEKFTVQGMPMPAPSKTKAPASSWQSQHQVMGHTIRVGDLRPIGPERVQLRITVSPAINRQGLILLSAKDEAGNEAIPIPNDNRRYAQMTGATSLGGGSTEFGARCLRPPDGKTLTLTFALGRATPVEFIIRPEFEP
jgi:hypothetical protein